MSFSWSEMKFRPNFSSRMCARTENVWGLWNRFYTQKRATWALRKRRLQFFLKLVYKLKITWKITFFGRWPRRNSSFWVIGVQSTPKMTFFQKIFQKFLKIFLLIDYDSAGYYLSFWPKSAHFKGPKTPKNPRVNRGHRIFFVRR